MEQEVITEATTDLQPAVSEVSADTDAAAAPKARGWKEFWRTVKYALVALSAGLIQMGVGTLFIEVAGWREGNNLYWVGYLIALVLSVLWNFTINRKVTFQSASNVPKAMMWVFAYYAVFAPCSILWQNAWLALPGWGDRLEVVVLLVTILINGITEFLWQRLFVFRKSIDTKPIEWKKSASAEECAAAKDCADGITVGTVNVNTTVIINDGVQTVAVDEISDCERNK